MRGRSIAVPGAAGRPGAAPGPLGPGLGRPGRVGGLPRSPRPPRAPCSRPAGRGVLCPVRSREGRPVGRPGGMPPLLLGAVVVWLGSWVRIPFALLAHRAPWAGCLPSLYPSFFVCKKWVPTSYRCSDGEQADTQSQGDAWRRDQHAHRRTVHPASDRAPRLRPQNRLPLQGWGRQDPRPARSVLLGWCARGS